MQPNSWGRLEEETYMTVRNAFVTVKFVFSRVLRASRDLEDEPRRRICLRSREAEEP